MEEKAMMTPLKHFPLLLAWYEGPISCSTNGHFWGLVPSGNSSFLLISGHPALRVCHKHPVMSHDSSASFQFIFPEILADF